VVIFQEIKKTYNCRIKSAIHFLLKLHDTFYDARNIVNSEPVKIKNKDDTLQPKPF